MRAIPRPVYIVRVTEKQTKSDPTFDMPKAAPRPSVPANA